MIGKGQSYYISDATIVSDFDRFGFDYLEQNTISIFSRLLTRISRCHLTQTNVARGPSRLH